MTGQSITNTLPGTESTTSYTSEASITTETGVLEEGQTYRFKVYMPGDLPKDSYYTLYVPTTVGMPSSGVSGLTLTCQQYCTASDITLSYSSSTRLITFTGAVPDTASYITSPGPLTMEIAGFTNPATSEAAYFQWSSYAVLSGTPYMVDQISSMYIQAT